MRGFSKERIFEKKFSYESENPWTDFRFDSHYGSRRLPAPHIMCFASTPPSFADGGVLAAFSSRWSALSPWFDPRSVSRNIH